MQALIGIAVFTTLVLLLAALVLGARARLLPSGAVAVHVNRARTLAARAGQRLLEVLLEAGIPLPSACAGKGTCGLCRVRVVRGGGPLLAVESAQLSRRERTEGVRLACQVVLRGDLELRLPAELLDTRELRVRVRSSRFLAPLLKELVLELPQGEPFTFRPGSFVLLTCPPFRLRLAEIEVEPRFRAEWERFELGGLEAVGTRPTTRAYSLANRPDEQGLAVLNVRLATPPPGAPPATPPGIVSSWLFARRPGDELTLAGPFGHFFTEESEREMVFVAGGAGMAPMRAHLFDLLERRQTRRRISFWYGARSRQELFYVEEFERLAAQHDNFDWTVALSEPRREDGWEGPTGFIHEVLRERHLARHPAPGECEYYLCGPPLMIRATLGLLAELGVASERIHCDDFGGQTG